MIRPQVNIGIAQAVLAAQRDRLLQVVPRLQTRIASDVLPRSQARTDATINRPLGAHRRPTDFETPKQRRWWFAVGVTLWHGRKDKQDWVVQHEVTAAGGRIVVVNPMPGAKYVFVPPFQQRMHVSTWLDSDTYAQQEGAAASQDIQALWTDVAAGEGGL